jgi:hypothetical protein
MKVRERTKIDYSRRYRELNKGNVYDATHDIYSKKHGFYQKVAQGRELQIIINLFADRAKELESTINLNQAYKKLPIHLSHIKDAIDKSEYIYSLSEDWDGEGSVGYKKATWLRAVNFISNYAFETFDSEFTIITSPLIYEGPKGSIDIIWENENFRLGINVPEDENIPVSYYSDNRGKIYERSTINDVSKIKKGLIEILLNFSK